MLLPLSESSACQVPICTVAADGLSGKDKGGPSKGGFLNNLLFS